MFLLKESRYVVIPLSNGLRRSPMKTVIIAWEVNSVSDRTMQLYLTIHKALLSGEIGDLLQRPITIWDGIQKEDMTGLSELMQKHGLVFCEQCGFEYYQNAKKDGIGLPHTIPESGFSDINPMQVVLQCSGVYGILSVIAQIQDGLTFLSILLLEGY